MIYKNFKAIILAFFLISTISHAQQMLVTENNSVQIIINGKEHYLHAGDVINVDKIEGWKRNITIVSTSNSNIKTKSAIIGNVRLGELLDNEHLKPHSFSYTANSKIEILAGDGSKLWLTPGDEIEIGPIDGWKRAVKIKSGAVLNKNQTYYLGDRTFAELVASNKLKPQVGLFKQMTSEMDAFIENLLQTDNSIDEDEGQEVSAPENLECPTAQKSFKLTKSISIVKVKNKQDTIPEGTIINALKTEKGVCYFSIQKLPEGSSLSPSDFPEYAASYPSNFDPNNLEEYTNDKKVDLARGLVFSPSEGLNLRAIGRRTGKAYTFNHNDKIKIKSIHPNGSFVVTKNNEKFEYRINPDELNELNEQGALEISFEDTVSEVSENNLFNVVVNEDDCKTCHEIDSILETDVPVMEEDLNFEACREKDIRTKSGKILKANNYLDKIFDISAQEAKSFMSDDKVKNMAACIGRSMHNGGARHTNPSCQKDASGNIKPSPIRISKKNAQGKHIGWTLINSVPRPCASMQTSAFMAKRFLMASACLGVDPKEVFPIINHESHFGATAISPSFAQGAGQIVTENYLDFYIGLNEAKKYISSNHNFFQQAKNFKSLKGYAEYEKMPGSKKLPRTTTFFMSDLQDKLNSSNPNCQGLKQIYNNPFKLPDTIKGDRQAFNYVRERENDRLCRPKNPDEGMYMSMIYYLTNKKYSQYYLSVMNSEVGNLIPPSKVADWSIILSRYMYNGGVGGILSVMQTFVKDLKGSRVSELDSKGNETGRKIGVSRLSNLSNDEFKRYLSHYIKYRYPSSKSSRRSEVAKYVTGVGGVGGIDGDLRKIEKEGKGVCGNTY